MRRWMVTGKAEKALEKAAITLERYRKNKTLVPPEELAGKYKKSFERLEQQLKAELEEYLKLRVIEGLQIIDNDEGRRTIDRIDQMIQASGAGREVGRAAFQRFDLEEIERLAGELHWKIHEEIYKPYVERWISGKEEGKRG